MKLNNNGIIHTDKRGVITDAQGIIRRDDEITLELTKKLLATLSKYKTNIIMNALVATLSNCLVNMPNPDNMLGMAKDHLDRTVKAYMEK